MSHAHRPRVVVAVPIAPELVERMSARDDIDVVWEPALLPPRRHPGDYAGDPAFHRDADEQERYDQLVDSADILFGLPDTSPAALARTVAANPALRWVHTMAAGGGSQVRDAGIDPDRLAALRVSTSAGVHGQGLAEFAVLGILAGLKDLPRWQRDQAAHHWPDRAPVRQVRDARVLVLGTGGIGSRTAELLSAFGTTVIGLVRSADSRPAGPFAETVTVESLDRVLPTVDAVVAALPDTPRTRGFVGASFLTALRPGAIVVNVGRGTVVDEGALVAALADGRVGYAALDVFECEPLPADSPLWSHERVLVSPHTAALDAGEEERIVALFLDNLDRFRAGDTLINEMDPDEFY
jgi:phosphoglycerate dehydrogenase-like enzyme